MSYEVLKHRFVGAIHIGTTNSCYAFSSEDDIEEEPLKINANVWNAGARFLMSHKAPTALLLNRGKSFEAFGYEAENRYSQIAQEADDPKDIEKYYFFNRFKMILHQLKQIRRDTPVEDETGKSLSAQLVYSLTIRYLKDHLYKSVQDRIPDIKSDDIKYVLTVPAIWDDPAKQFMREAAKLAGIKEDQLAIALEPEAALIFCMQLPVERAGVGKETFLKVANSGTKYMVVDLGRNIDITVHQRQRDGTLKELRLASGGAWGGISVDDAFKKFLEEIAGATNIETLKDESMEDYIDLFREFETKKRSITSEKQGKTSITMPVTLIDIVKRDKAKKGFAEALKQSKYIDTVNFTKQKLQIANDTFRDLFRETIEGIIECIQEILDDSKFRDLQHILMVGGFSESELVQNAVREKYKNQRIIVPDEAGLAVLKGAVLYGHGLRTITSRVARKTYGIQSWPEFDPRKHPPEKKVVIDGVARCKDVFYKYIEIGQQVTPGHQESQMFQALKPDEESLECAVYASTNRNPMFVDEAGCTRLGVITVPLERSRGGPVEVEETMIFGETELLVQAKDMGTGRGFEAYFNFLHNPDD